MTMTSLGVLVRYTARLAELTLEDLKRRHPHHPAATWTQTRSQPLEATLWTDLMAHQVLESINHVLYLRLQLLGDDAPENPEGDEDAELHDNVSVVI